MVNETANKPVNGAKPGLRVGAPPLPHEHGAWVMLYAPMLIAFAVTGAPFGLPELLLLIAVTGAYLAREPADLLLRGRGKEGSAFWAASYAGIAAAAALPLLLRYHLDGLVTIGLIAGVLFAIHAVMLKWPSKRRMDRSEGGEALAVLGLTLTAPAAYVAATGQFDGLAICLWCVCALYFGSSIFHVKMLLAAVKQKGGIQKGEMTMADRLRIGRWNLLYHAILVVLVLATMGRAGSAGGLLLAVAYLPIVLRTLWGTLRLSRRLPPLKRVGVFESVYALWFTAFTIAGLVAGR